MSRQGVDTSSALCNPSDGCTDRPGRCNPGDYVEGASGRHDSSSASHAASVACLSDMRTPPNGAAWNNSVQSDSRTRSPGWSGSGSVSETLNGRAGRARVHHGSSRSTARSSATGVPRRHPPPRACGAPPPTRSSGPGHLRDRNRRQCSCCPTRGRADTPRARRHPSRHQTPDQRKWTHKRNASPAWPATALAPQAANLRQHAVLTHLRAEAHATFRREAEAADCIGDSWLDGAIDAREAV